MKILPTLLVSIIVLFCFFSLSTQNKYPLELKKTEDRLKTLVNRTCEDWHGPPEDCPQLTEPNCLAVGCIWIANYNGPWCQFPVPPQCIPTTFERISHSVSKFAQSEYTELNPIQVTAFWITFFSLVIILSTMVWAESKVPALDLRLAGNWPELRGSDNLAGLKNNSTSFLSAGETLIEGPFSAKKNDDLIEDDIFSEEGTNRGSAVRRRKLNSDSLPTEISGNHRRLNSRGQNNSLLNNKIAQIVLGPTPDWVVNLVVCIVLFVVGEYLKLWRLGTPAALTFDECHFGYFVSHYYARTYFFDIHPPFAKVTFWFLGNLLGHDPGPNGEFQYKGKMGVPYDNWYQYYPLRFVATMFGSGVIPVMYLLLRTISIRPAGAMFGACLVLFDSLLISEARGILTDSQLIFWNCITIYGMLKLFTIPGYPAKEFAAKRERLLNKWTILTAIFCGCVFSIKFTSLATLGIIFMESYFALFIIEKRLSFLRCLAALSIGFFVWMFWWFMHFAILINDTSESAWHTPHFQSTLIGNAFRGKLSGPWFPFKAYELVYTMIKANAQTLEPHDWGSRWYEWIVGRGKLLSAAATSEELGYTENWEISIFANPLIAVITLGSIAVSVALCMFYSRYQHIPWIKTQPNRNFVGLTLLCLFGWLANLLPYTGIARSTFVYHYLPGQLYVQILSALLLDRIVSLGPGLMRNLITSTLGKKMSDQIVMPKGLLRFGAYTSLTMYGLLITGLGLSWWFFTPWLYAIPLKQDQHQWRKYFLGR